MQFSPEGKLLHHYTVLDGLTESDLTTLALFDSKLFIGTATRGLLAFDGERFESYRWLDREPQAINAMLEERLFRYGRHWNQNDWLPGDSTTRGLCDNQRNRLMMSGERFSIHDPVRFN